MPFRSSENYSLSDGSVSILTETTESAKKRGAEIYCRITGYGMSHASVPYGTVKGSAAGLYNAIGSALADADLTAGDISAVIGFANGQKDVDEIETDVLSRYFDGKELPVITVKERTGEGRAASAALALAHGAMMLHGDIAEDADAYVSSGNGMKKVGVKASALNKILVLSYATGGSYTAIVLEK